MVSKTTKIVNRMGLHARPASTFVVEAKKFESDIRIGKRGGHPINAKSIMMVLAGAFNAGDEVIISCDGEDEQEAVEKMVSLLESGLGNQLVG